VQGEPRDTVVLMSGYLPNILKGGGTVMGMNDESDPGQDVSGRWIGGLIALAIVIWVVYFAVTHGGQ
jgi:hypothetical protein